MRWTWWPTLAETGLDEHNTPSLGRNSDRGRVARVVAARHTEQFRNSEFDIRAIAVVLVLTRGDGQRPRTVVPALGLTVIGLRGSVLMTPAKAHHSHAASAAGKGVKRDNRGEQNGERTMLHGREYTSAPAGRCLRTGAAARDVR